MEIKEEIRKLVEVLRVANDAVIGETARILFNLKWKEGLSARNQAHKILDELAFTHQIMKGKGFYAVRDYQGSYGQHDIRISHCLSEIIKVNPQCLIHREVAFEPALRSDAAVLLRRDGQGLCFILEVLNHEKLTPEYTRMKVNTWEHWQGANEALSRLFGYQIRHFSIVISRNEPEDEFNQLIRRLK